MTANLCMQNTGLAYSGTKWPKCTEIEKWEMGNQVNDKVLDYLIAWYIRCSVTTILMHNEKLSSPTHPLCFLCLF